MSLTNLLATAARALRLLWRFRAALSPAVEIIREAGQFANLTAEQRRDYVLTLLRKWMNERAEWLSDQQLALLVELAYSFAKPAFGSEFAPKPFQWGTPREPIAPIRSGALH